MRGRGRNSSERWLARRLRRESSSSILSFRLVIGNSATKGGCFIFTFQSLAFGPRVQTFLVDLRTKIARLVEGLAVPVSRDVFGRPVNGRMAPK